MYKIILFLFVIIIITNSAFSQLNNSVYNGSVCGLNIFQQAAKVTNRFATPAGTGLPVRFNVTQLPANCYTIEAAYVWSVLSYTAASPNPLIVSVTDPLNKTTNFNATLTGQAGPKCWPASGEIGTRGWRANVASAITGNGNYTINLNTNQAEVDGITLLVIYRDLRANYEGHLIIDDGIVTVAAGGTSSNSTITGFSACAASTFASAFSIVSDIQNGAGGNLILTMNGAVNNFNRNFWNSEMIVTSVAQGQTTSPFTVNPNGNDCYSWIAAGLYYQTTTCKTCPDNPLVVNATASKLAICPADNVVLDASGATTYSWTSNPPGFTSNLKNPTVNPTVTTTYTVRGFSSDACNNYQRDATVTVTVLPIPTANTGKFAEVCLGSSIIIGNPATGGSPPYQYSWSPGNGLSSTTIQSPVASPTVTTVYNLTVTDANGCVGTDAITVQVNPLPVANPGPDKTTCFMVPVQIGGNATGGTPGYTYSWSPSAGLNATNLPVVTANPNDTTIYTVTVTDSKNCVSSGKVKVNILPLPKVSIIPIDHPVGPIVGVCSCDSVILTTDSAFVTYLWSTGATTRSIIVKPQINPVNYTVTVTDKNGCINTSSPITVNIIQPAATVYLPKNQIQAAPGQVFNVPLKLDSYSNLDTCKYYNFTANVSFEKTIMVPSGSTQSGTQTTDKRIIPVKGIRKTGDSLLTTLEFMATLGDVEQSPFQIESFQFDECAFPVGFLNSSISLLNLCKEGGTTRLFKSSSTAGLDIYPNPNSGFADINFNLQEAGFVQIQLMDLLGRKIKDIYSGSPQPGPFKLNADLNDVCEGVYMMLLVTQSGSETQMIEVKK